MDRFQSLLAFTKVVETGSFARATDRLALSVSAVSRQVAELESHLGVRLLNRTTRRLSLTESGKDSTGAVQLADLQEAEEVGHFGMAFRAALATHDIDQLGVRYLASALAEFSQQHPQLRFDAGCRIGRSISSMKESTLRSASGTSAARR